MTRLRLGWLPLGFSLAAFALSLGRCGGATVSGTQRDGSTATSSGAGGSTGGSSGTGGPGGSSGTSRDGGLTDGSPGGASSGTCTPQCATALSCCSGHCVNAANDPQNCGACGNVCGGSTPFCLGQCMATPCKLDAGACGGESCCGYGCCGQGQLCCLVVGPGAPQPKCYALQDGQATCPIGCPLCM
jgi:hypothetical protein